MNSKLLASIAIALWIVSAAVIGYKFVNGTTVTGTDGRDAIALSAEERNFVLAEMRNLLIAVQDVIAAVNAGDMEAVKKSAHRVGMAEVGNAPPALMMKFPMSFKSLGLSAHEGFDEIALAAETGPEAVMEALEQNMSKCVACHEAYRFSE